MDGEQMIKDLRIRALQISLDNHLSDYFDAEVWEKTTLEELTKLERGDDIVVWQPFEDIPMKELAEMIEDLATAIEYEFGKD